MIKNMKYKFLNKDSKEVAFISLIIIFFILLAQSTISLFYETTNNGIAQIDIVFRTSLSSIFGYLISLISTNNIKNKLESKTNTLTVSKDNSCKPPKKTNPLNYQILLISFVCIFCLVLMIFIRYCSFLIVQTASSISTITVFRDFVSTSIGALIGLSKN